VKTVKFTVPEDFAGPEWAGDYEAREISALEYLDIAEKLSREAEEKGLEFDALPKGAFNLELIKTCVRKDEKPLNVDLGSMPAKIYELLTDVAMKLNTLLPKEKQRIFLQSSKEGPVSR